MAIINESKAEQPKEENIQYERSNNDCIACANGLLPSGNEYVCAVCDSPVHVLKGCSVSFGNKDDARRICISCNMNSLTVAPISLIKQAKPNEESSLNKRSVGCKACAIGNSPSGDAHKCIVCSVPVHLLEGCSVSCGDEEGYGERRICISCNSKKSNDLSVKVNLNEAVVYDKKEKRSQTSYSKSQPNWIPKSNKKLEISILQDASLSNTTHLGQMVKLKNSSSFDALCHLFALAYNYHPKGQNFDAFHQAVFRIAIKLAKR